MYVVNPSIFKHSRPCQDCGEMFMGHFNRRYCDKCPGSDKRNYNNPSGQNKTVKQELCLACGTSLAGMSYISRFCRPCGLSEKRFARARLRANGSTDFNEVSRLITKYAVKVGFLPMPELFACMDCGDPATCYDHRDYNTPLVVDPVCGRCNSRRGPGIAMKPKHLKSVS